MADFFTTLSVAPVDKATTTQKAAEDQVPTSVVSHQSDAAPPKTTGSNFSMCEIIM